MYTATIDIANDKALNVLKGLEALDLIHFHSDEQTDVPQWQQDKVNRREADYEAGHTKMFSLEEADQHWQQLKKQAR